MWRLMSPHGLCQQLWIVIGFGLELSPLLIALEQLKTFLVRMQDDPDLKARVLAAATADDVAKIAAGLG